MPLILPNTIQNAIPADGDKLGQNFATITDWANQEAITRDGSTGMVAPLLLPGPPTQPDQAATKGYVDGFLPPGIMFQYGGITEPAGWMFCRGQAISRATYAALFTAIGTRFGTGNGSTTFNLPDMRGRYPIGHNEGGTYFSVGVGESFGNKDAIVVAHTHPGVDHVHGVNITSGAEDRNHYHYMRGREVNPVSAPSFGQSVVIDKSATGFGFVGQTDGVDGPHHHPVVGSTGAADRNLTTGSTGSSGQNANLPPSISFNFIMKVT